MLCESEFEWYTTTHLVLVLILGSSVTHSGTNGLAEWDAKDLMINMRLFWCGWPIGVQKQSSAAKIVTRNHRLQKSWQYQPLITKCGLVISTFNGAMLIGLRNRGLCVQGPQKLRFPWRWCQRIAAETLCSVAAILLSGQIVPLKP